jgi:hypothetical protein
MVNLEGFGRKKSWPNLRQSRRSTGGTEKKHEILSRGRRSQGGVLKPGPPEYETGVLALDHDVRF